MPACPCDHPLLLQSIPNHSCSKASKASLVLKSIQSITRAQSIQSITRAPKHPKHHKNCVGLSIILHAVLSPRRAQRRQVAVEEVSATCHACRAARRPSPRTQHRSQGAEAGWQGGVEQSPSCLQSSYFPPLSKPSSSALVRALPRRPDPRPMARTPVGADLATADFAWPSPRQWRDPHTKFGNSLGSREARDARRELAGALGASILQRKWLRWCPRDVCITS